MKKSFSLLLCIAASAGVMLSSVALANSPLLPNHVTVAIIDNGYLPASNTKPSDYARIKSVKFEKITGYTPDSIAIQSPLTSQYVTSTTNLNIGPYDQALNVKDSYLNDLGLSAISFTVTNVTVQQGHQKHVISCDKYPGTVTPVKSLNVVYVGNETPGGPVSCVIAF